MGKWFRWFTAGWEWDGSMESHFVDGTGLRDFLAKQDVTGSGNGSRIWS